MKGLSGAKWELQMFFGDFLNKCFDWFVLGDNLNRKGLMGWPAIKG